MRYLLLLIEDDAELSAFLKEALEAAGYRVVTAGTGKQGLRELVQWSPNLVILDLMLPDMDGFEICRRIRKYDPKLPILILTGRKEVADRVRGLNLGADDYLVKPFDLQELHARIQALLRRAYEAQPGVYRFLDLTFDPMAREARRGQRIIPLTQREARLLQVFMEHPRQVLTRDFLYQEVWGYGYGQTSNVLDVYIRYLRRKLEAQGEPRLIHTVRGVGYILREPEEVGISPTPTDH